MVRFCMSLSSSSDMRRQRATSFSHKQKRQRIFITYLKVLCVLTVACQSHRKRCRWRITFDRARDGGNKTRNTFITDWWQYFGNLFIIPRTQWMNVNGRWREPKRLNCTEFKINLLLCLMEMAWISIAQCTTGWPISIRASRTTKTTTPAHFMNVINVYAICMAADRRRVRLSLHPFYLCSWVGKEWSRIHKHTTWNVTSASRCPKLFAKVKRTTLCFCWRYAMKWESFLYSSSL